MVAREACRPSHIAKALVLAMLAAPSAALAGSPEDDYLAARDRDIADLKKLENPEDAAAHNALQEMDTKDLERRLRAMVGPFAVAGFPAEGKLNADLYLGDRSFGELDGLAYGDRQSGGGVIVTTDGLLDKWLLRHPRRWSKIDVPRAAAAAAVKTEAFYTQATSEQGDVAHYAVVPLVAPPGAKFATATLSIVDTGPEIPETPDRLLIALEHGGRVFIVDARLATPMKAVAACDAVLDHYENKADAAEKGLSDAGSTDPKSEDKVEKLAAKLRDQGQAAFLSCFGDKVRATPEFKSATHQAAAIVAALTGR